MDRSILNKYNQEEKLILSKIIDKINFCDKKNSLQVTDFLDLAKQELVRKFLKSKKIENYIFYGAYKEAERKVAIIYPDKLESLIKEDKFSYNEFINVIRINLPEELYGEYNHQRYLGGLIKLGIKREKIGDILVEKDGADIIISKDVEKFLLSNLTELTRFKKSEIKEIPINEIRKIEIEKQVFKITVSSMRLDNIIAELAHCSRSKAEILLNDQRVFVNYENVIKPTKEIKENDKITIRGKGRFEIKEIVGNTRSGRYIVNIEK